MVIILILLQIRLVKVWMLSELMLLILTTMSILNARPWARRYTFPSVLSYRSQLQALSFSRIKILGVLLTGIEPRLSAPFFSKHELVFIFAFVNILESGLEQKFPYILIVYSSLDLWISEELTSLCWNSRSCIFFNGWAPARKEEIHEPCTQASSSSYLLAPLMKPFWWRQPSSLHTNISWHL